MQSTHVNLCCSTAGPTGVMSQSNINAWHFGQTLPLIVAARISVRRCDILHSPSFGRSATLTVTRAKPIRAVIQQFCTPYAAVSTDLSLLFLQRLPAWRFSSTFIQLTRMVIYRHASARRRSFKKLVKSASARVSAGLRPFDGILSILQNHPGEQYSSHWLAALELQAGTAPLHRRGICEPLAL